jgi:hypothetical protein
VQAAKTEAGHLSSMGFAPTEVATALCVKTGAGNERWEGAAAIDSSVNLSHSGSAANCCKRTGSGMGIEAME